MKKDVPPGLAKKERVPTDALPRIRRPNMIFTDAYRDDPIQFKPDQRLIPETVLRQLDSESLVERDPAEYAVVNVNAANSVNYTVTMISAVYNRDDVERKIDKTFTHF